MSGETQFTIFASKSMFSFRAGRAKAPGRIGGSSNQRFRGQALGQFGKAPGASVGLAAIFFGPAYRTRIFISPRCSRKKHIKYSRNTRLRWARTGRFLTKPIGGGPARLARDPRDRAG